jgi:hypothetical protein
MTPTTHPDTTLPLRITLQQPPPGFAYCLQEGRGKNAFRHDYQVAEGSDLCFDLSVTARMKNGKPNLLGPFAQGTPDARFFYICVGQVDEPSEPLWTGRIKVPLTAIHVSLVAAVSGKSATRLEASFAATGPKGRPVLASVHLIGNGWTIGSR